jgi:hypothetical protein
MRRLDATQLTSSNFFRRSLELSTVAQYCIFIKISDLSHASLGRETWQAARIYQTDLGWVFDQESWIATPLGAQWEPRGAQREPRMDS